MGLYEYVRGNPVDGFDGFGLQDGRGVGPPLPSSDDGFVGPRPDFGPPAHIVTKPVVGKDKKGVDDDWESRNKTALEKYAKDNPDVKVLTVKDVDDFNKQVKGVRCKCVEKLEITGHGNSWADSAIQDIGSTNEASSSSWGGKSALVVEKNKLKDFKSVDYWFRGMDAFKDINFCKPCTIVLRGCNVGKTERGKLLMTAVAHVTGCAVEAFDDKPGTWLDNGLPGLPNAPHGPNVKQAAPVLSK